MATVIAVLGALIGLLGLLGVINPQAMIKIGNRFRTPPGMYAAVAIRFATGVFLIIAGPSCRLDVPWVGTAVRLIGVVAIVAAVVLLVLGPNRFRAIVDWSLARPPGVLRLWSLIAVVFGGFLLYAGT